jgi:outer membrane protein assembly factor BamB
MRFLVLLAAVGALFAQDPAANWPQFRGPNASGIAAAGAAPPVEFGTSLPAGKQRLLWKQAVPEGHSSPAVWGERIFLTAFDSPSQKLELICLSRKTGAILWRHGAPAEQIEKTHLVSNPATATPAVDGERVYAYFGSFGLMAVSHAGEPAWNLPLPMPRTSHGSGASPILAGDLVILNHDGIQGGYLLAVDRRTGKEAWRQAYPAPGGRRESYSTPILWHDQLVLHRAGVVDAYDAATGQPRWSLATATSGLSTPVASGDTIFAQTWNVLGEDDQRGALPDFATLLKKYDKDGDGAISESEYPADLMLTVRPGLEKIPNSQNPVTFRSVDKNRDGLIQKDEWEAFLTAAAGMAKDHGLLALRPDGATAKILWRTDTSIPEVPSPLLYKDRLFLVRNGGVVSCLDAATGKLIYRARTGATGPYFASPVEAGGRLYLVSGDGVVTVIAADKDRFEVLAKNELGEDVYSSPAIAGNAIYVRTARSLLAFGER